MNANREFESLFPMRRCINLTRRPDRWERVQAQFARHEIAVERQTACDSEVVEPPAGWQFSRGAFACAVSHSDAIRAAREAGAPAIFVFEDDVELHPELPALMKRFLAQLPANWDGIWLGGIHRSEPVPVSEHASRLVESDSTFAYGLRERVYEDFLALNGRLRTPVDLTTKELQGRYNFYCSVPPLAWVTQDYSDVQGAQVNFWWLREGLTVDGDRCRRMLENSGVLILPSSRGAISPDAASYAIRRYAKIFPEVVVVGYEPDNREWPENCRFETEPTGTTETANRFERMARAVRLLPECRYLLITEIDLYMRPWDLKASLLKCADNDMVYASGGALRSGDIPQGEPCFFLGRMEVLAGLEQFPIDGARIFHCPAQALRLSNEI